MKNIVCITAALFINAIATACDLCKAKQPKGFENITHGEGPEGNFDYVIMLVALLIVGFTLIMSIKYLIRPNEDNKRHIKHFVLNNENTLD